MSWCGCRLAPFTLHTLSRESKTHIYRADPRAWARQIGEKSVSVLLVLLRKNLALIQFGQKIMLVLIWCTLGLHGLYGQFGAAYMERRRV
jgi:hypothetical protein